MHETTHTRVLESCDACRTHKTKCSGGTQCLQCVRRGISCTFRDRLRRSTDASTNGGPSTSDARSLEDDNYSQSTLPTTSGRENCPTGTIAQGREWSTDASTAAFISTSPGTSQPPNKRTWINDERSAKCVQHHTSPDRAGAAYPAPLPSHVPGTCTDATHRIQKNPY